MLVLCEQVSGARNCAYFDDYLFTLTRPYSILTSFYLR
jgi:hypothetical protein